MRTIIHTYKYKDKADDTIYLDISNPGYDGSAQNEKAALIIYDLKGYQTDLDGTFYDQAFVLNDGDFTLQANLYINDVEIKNYDRGYTIDNDTIRLQKDLDLSGYALKNFQPKIIITGLSNSKDGHIVKFGNSEKAMAPFLCILDGVSVKILDKGDSKNCERIGFRFFIYPLSTRPLQQLSYKTFKSIRNANGLEYQYVEPVLINKKIKFNPGQHLELNLCQPDDPLQSALANTKSALVSLILIDDYSFTR